MRKHLALALLCLPRAWSLVLDPSFHEILLAGRIHREPNFVPRRLVESLRSDVAALESMGLFAPAGSGEHGSGESNGMRRAEYADPIDRDRDLGEWDAFVDLWERLEAMRLEISDALYPIKILDEVEIHYVRYPIGGFFQRHVDEVIDPEEETPASRRAVSFVCYLNEPGWSPGDGGALLAHHSPGPMEEFLPESGSLLLFGSLQVEHEVLPTNRERTCLVGWFHTPSVRGGIRGKATPPQPALLL